MLVHHAVRVSDMADRVADPRDVPLRVTLGQLLRVVPELIPGSRRLLGIEAGLLEVLLVPGEAVDVDPVLRVPPHPPLAVVGEGADLRGDGIEPCLGPGVGHGVEHLLLEEAGDPGAIHEQDVTHVLGGGGSEDLLLHRVVVEAHRLDLDARLRLERREEALVTEVRRSRRDVTGRIPERDRLRLAPRSP
jgi:hypothetical protein